MLTNIERTNHINYLAKTLGTKLVIDDKFITSAMMYVEFGYIEVPPCTNQINYLINLHELGHVFHGHTQGRPPCQDKKFYFENGVLKSEAQAWEWALDQCMEPIEDSSRIFMWDNCLGSYYKHCYIDNGGIEQRLYNGNRHWIPFVCDKPDEYFTGIVGRIQGNLCKLSNFKIEYIGQ